MNYLFGMRSDMKSNSRLKNGYTLFDWVMRQRGFPAFWFRPLLGENPLTEEEIKFLNSKDCKIALVLDNLSETIVSGTNGTREGLAAVEAATNMGVPQYSAIAIFANIKEGWSVNHNWMISFAQTLASNGYVPGFIGNTDSSKNFNFDRQCSHYIQATGNVHNFNAVYCATEPKCVGDVEEWSPYCPSAIQPDDIHLWMAGTITFDTIISDAIYARDKKILMNMWEGK